jgi:NADH-quinone oxidoreductase subunit L
MTRLVMLTFFGQPKDHHAHEHAHESPLSMTAPLLPAGGAGAGRRLRP